MIKNEVTSEQLAPLIAWTLREGVTPEFKVETITRISGEGPSPDEKGLRFGGSHHYFVVALEPDCGGLEANRAIERFATGSCDIDSSFSPVGLIRPYLEACYKALVGAELPCQEEDGSEKYLASGTWGEGVNLKNWEIVRVNGTEGFFVEIRYNFPNDFSPKTIFRRRLIRGSFRDSKRHVGGKYIPGFKSALASLTKEEWSEVEDAFS